MPFQKGQSGNPAGRVKGKAALLAAELRKIVSADAGDRQINLRTSEGRRYRVAPSFYQTSATGEVADSVLVAENRRTL